MRNSWAPRAVVLVVLSVFSFSDVAFGRPVPYPRPLVAPFSYPVRQTSTSSLKTRSIQENTNTLATNSGDSSAPNFGKCSTPEIKFAKGLDNRKETAYEAVDSSSRHVPAP
jgi:hypothetical protein